MERKNAVFQTLKPPCVALSQATLNLNRSQGSEQTVIKRLETLKDALKSAASRSDALDPKIAEYVFFPISQVLKFSQNASIRVLELCLQCIAILIEQGWRKQIPAQLAGQLVIFCSMLSERNPKNLAFLETTDELQASALNCLYQLFSVVRNDSETAKLLRSEANFPQLGQTISVTLDAIEIGRSVEVQTIGTNTFRALLSNVMDAGIQAGFLPGIVSKLTKILPPQTKTRRNHMVLTGCLESLRLILRNTMSDVRQTQRIDGTAHAKFRDEPKQAHSLMSPQWHEEAALQLKPALAKITRLKAHSRAEVQDALGSLCSMILQHCRKSLANCAYLALDTLVAIAASGKSTTTNVEIEVLVLSESSILALLEETTYDWLQSIATLMQGSDEQAKATKMRQINIAYELLVKAKTDTTTIDRMLATALRDIVILTLALPAGNSRSISSSGSMVSTDLAISPVDGHVTDFSSPLIRLTGQEAIMASVEQMAGLVSSSATGSNFTNDLVRHLRYSQGETQIANFWLLLTATKAMSQQKDAVDDLLNLDPEIATRCNEYVEEMYSLALSVLADSSDAPHDSRLQAIALRALALRAETAGRDFRYDLVDALYPVLHTLATPDEALQRDSVVALNVFASACGYTSVKDLIVENVDYLTNAVALRLNAFDVSPQAPQVLLMMVRLAGPSLLPYLEDTVESIFAALEDYHGYSLLVELLFKVLGVITQEGVKNPQLAIANDETRDASSVLLDRWHTTTVAGLADVLQENVREDRERSVITTDVYEPHPKKPWKGLNEAEEDSEEWKEIADEQNAEIDMSEPPPPAAKTYHLLLKIANLTQHFLPSASPSLRASLLALVSTITPAIARHENSFLPLINTLWPEIVSRLDDHEDFVIDHALVAVQVLCEYAREFMRTRIIQLWPRLEEIHKNIFTGPLQTRSQPFMKPADSAESDPLLLQNGLQAKNDLHVVPAASTPYHDTSQHLLRDHFVACLTAIVRFVQISPEMIDEALTMLQPYLLQEEVHAAFAEENDDALWLMQLRAKSVAVPNVPTSPNHSRWRFATTPV